LLSYRLGLTGAKSQIPANWTNATEITITNNIDWYVIRNIAHFLFFENEIANYTPSGSYLFLFNNASGKTFFDIAQELNINETDLRKENTWCNTNTIPTDKNYTVLKLVKKDQKVPIIAKNNTINKPFFDIEVGYPILKIDERKSRKNNAIFYTINGKDGILSIIGDDAKTIADRAELKLQYFLSYNDLDNNEAITPQMVYYLEKKNRKAKVPKHLVKKGQSLWLISQMYGIRENRLLRINRMKKGESLQEGRYLNLIEKRKRKEAIEFKIKPFENEQLPTEAPRIIIADPVDSYPNKMNVPEKETELTITKNIPETPIFQEPPTTFSTGPQMKVIVRDAGDIPKKIETKIESKIYDKPIEKTASNITENQKYIIVKTGDNLFNLAKKYNVSVTELKRINGITTNTVELGQKLILPIVITESTLPKNTESNFKILKNDSSKTTFHIVKSGETLYRVSVIYKVTVDQIKKLNNLVDNSISVGQKLIITK
jgi:membrane-bound lytic murein transglycosylase D